MFYYSIYLDASEYNRINTGLYIIISEIGKHRVKTKSGQPESEEQHFKNGLNYLNRRLNKFHKTALNHLVFANLCLCEYPSINPTVKYQWKFHRTKSIQILKLIHQQLESLGNEYTLKLFASIYSYLAAYGVWPRGDYITGFPYYTTIQQQASQKKVNTQRGNTLSKIANRIEDFSCFYDNSSTRSK